MKNAENQKNITEIEENLPKNDFSENDFKSFWEKYLSDISHENRPAYNVLNTVDWKINEDKNVILNFDSEAMSIEFENLRDNFTINLREKLNNYYIQIEKVVNTVASKKKHIKSRKDIFEELVQINPNLTNLQKIMDLDIDNEPSKR